MKSPATRRMFHPRQVDLVRLPGGGAVDLAGQAAGSRQHRGVPHFFLDDLATLLVACPERGPVDRLKARGEAIGYATWPIAPRDGSWQSSQSRRLDLSQPPISCTAAVRISSCSRTAARQAVVLSPPQPS